MSLSLIKRHASIFSAWRTDCPAIRPSCDVCSRAVEFQFRRSVKAHPKSVSCRLHPLDSLFLPLNVRISPYSRILEISCCTATECLIGQIPADCMNAPLSPTLQRRGDAPCEHLFAALVAFNHVPDELKHVPSHEEPRRQPPLAGDQKNRRNHKTRRYAKHVQPEACRVLVTLAPVGNWVFHRLTPESDAVIVEQLAGGRLRTGSWPRTGSGTACSGSFRETGPASV